MKIWITKYALSKGVFEAEAEVSDERSTMAVVRPAPASGGHTQYFHGCDWHKTKTAADARVRHMIKLKLASLEKQKQKLLKLLKEHT